MSFVSKRICDICKKEMKKPSSFEELNSMMFKSQLNEICFTYAATGIDMCASCAKKIDEAIAKQRYDWLNEGERTDNND